MIRLMWPPQLVTSSPTKKTLTRPQIYSTIPAALTLSVVSFVVFARIAVSPQCDPSITLSPRQIADISTVPRDYTRT
ncbi:uncharacterized protein METZ01_LOCUS260368, partial [marine metagenome]